MDALDRADQPDLGHRPWVAYVGPFAFPWGQAGSRRVAGVAASILGTGRDVVVVSGHEDRGTRLVEEHASGARLWVVGTGEQPGSVGVVRRNIALHGTAGAAAVRWLDGQPTAPTHVIVYGGGYAYARRVRAWTRRHGVGAIADVVEWYAPRQFTGGVLSPSWLSAHLALRLAYPRYDGVIAVSDYLWRLYAAKKLPVVTIPPTVDMSSIPMGRGGDTQGKHATTDGRESRLLVLCYFGTPGRKDLLPEILQGFALARARCATPDDLELMVAGPSKQEMASAAGGAIPAGVTAVGHLPQDQIGTFVRNADFSVLLRPQARYSEAGFPTKFVESLANGTPVIANLTSDLGRYLVDGAAGFVVSEASGQALAVAISRAASLSPRERQEMRERARLGALATFDPVQHVDTVDALLTETAR